MRLKPNISIVHDTRKANKDKLYPVKLIANFQITIKNKKKWKDDPYPLKGEKYQYASKKDFAAAKSDGARTLKQKELRADMVAAEAKANKILDDHTFVTRDMFERLFTNRGSGHTVGQAFKTVMNELYEAGQIGHYLITKTARNSFARFVDPTLEKMKTRISRKTPDTISIDISFFEINNDWLKAYTKWAKDKGCSITTIGIYLEVLRKVYNRAITDNIVKADLYPFGKTGHKIRKQKARKTALDEYDKNRLMALKDDPDIEYGIAFWSFSFHSLGINPTDIAMLKFKNLSDVIDTHRQKTINTASGDPLVIPLRPEAKEVIARYGNKSLDPNEYVFPILSHGLTPMQIKNRIRHFFDKINKGLKKAGEILGVEIKMKNARHSFASIALEKGATLEFIQIALGHGSPMTTQIYTSGFGIKTKKAIGEKIYDS